MHIGLQGISICGSMKKAKLQLQFSPTVGEKSVGREHRKAWAENTEKRVQRKDRGLKVMQSREPFSNWVLLSVFVPECVKMD